MAWGQTATRGYQRGTAVSAPVDLVLEPSKLSPEYADRVAVRDFTGRGASVLLPFSRRLIRAARYAATDDRIPKALRASAAFGLLPVPVVTDVVLLAAAVPLGLFYRQPLADAWRRSGGP